MTDDVTRKAVACWVADLRQRGAALQASGDELLIDGPEELLTPGRLRDLKTYKPEILRILKGTA